MKIEYAVATGCPFGQFIVEAETSQEKAILSTFLQANAHKWKFQLHGWTYQCDGSGGVDSFNFGWHKEEKPNKKQTKRGAR
jgi:hypothetical protein